MSKLIQIRTCVAAALACLLAASCSDVTDGEPLPDRKSPMTFTAGVDGLAVSRATTENVWSGTEEVAIQIGGEVKKYVVAVGGRLSIASGDAPFYWQSTGNISVNAWYPYRVAKPADTELTVKADQSQGDAYQASDYLEVVDAVVTFGSLASLTFKHRTARVVVTLKAGEGVDDLTGAAVTFVNQKGVENNRTEVTPKAGAESGGSTSYTALVIPQQMKGKPFVKVTVGAGNDARDYYYTPTGSSDANLEAGKQYNYTVTVKKTGLKVKLTGNGAAVWGSGTDIDGGTPSIVGYHTLTIAGKNNLSNLEVKDADGKTINAKMDGTYQLPAAATAFSVSYDVSSNKTKSLVPTSGLCRLVRSADTNGSKYICNYSNVISDVALALDEYVQMGDFYYSDGTWGAPVTVPTTTANGTSPTVIGIVMKVGKDNDGNWKDDCRYKLKNTDIAMTTIHGYVLALIDAGKCAWSSTVTSVVYEVNGVDMMNRTDRGFYGYQNTQTLIGYNANKGGTLSIAFPAVYYATTYYESMYAAPDNSSGWFLPSAGQCWYWRQNKDAIDASMQQAGGKGWEFSYWSSSEYNNPREQAYFVSSKNNYVSGSTKTGPRFVRSFLVF